MQRPSLQAFARVATPAGSDVFESATVSDRSLVLSEGDTSVEISLDGVLDAGAEQVKVFNMVGHSAVQNVTSGRNACVLAFGHSGGGNTYSLVGQVRVLTRTVSWRPLGHNDRRVWFISAPVFSLRAALATSSDAGDMCRTDVPFTIYTFAAMLRGWLTSALKQLQATIIAESASSLTCPDSVSDTEHANPNCT
jgi:Kinesin motor domain